MDEHTDTGKSGKGPRGRLHTACFALAWCFLPVTFSACATPHQGTGTGVAAGPVSAPAAGNNKDWDPLLGPSLPSATSAPPAPAAPPAQAAAATPTASVPPVMLPASATSNAALAAGVARPRDPDRDLRIADPTGNSGWGGPGTAASDHGGGAVLRPPESVPPVSAPRDPMQTPVYGSSGGRLTSLEQAQALLTARGVNWQRLETATGGTGEWKFTCSIPTKQNPNINRKYEATAASPVAAIQAALDQIDKEN